MVENMIPDGLPLEPSSAAPADHYGVVVMFLKSAADVTKILALNDCGSFYSAWVVIPRGLGIEVEGMRCSRAANLLGINLANQLEKQGWKPRA